MANGSAKSDFYVLVTGANRFVFVLSIYLFFSFSSDFARYMLRIYV
jgi:hypothetical protein